MFLRGSFRLRPRARDVQAASAVHVHLAYSGRGSAMISGARSDEGNACPGSPQAGDDIEVIHVCN